MLKKYLNRSVCGLMLAVLVLLSAALLPVNSYCALAKFVKSDIQSPTLIRRVATIADLRLLSGSSTIPAVQVMGYYTDGDGAGGPLRIWKDGAAPGTYVDNGGSIIVPTGGDGSEAWVWTFDGPYSVADFGCIGSDTLDDSACFQATVSAVNSDAGVIRVPKDFLLTLTSGVSGGPVRIVGDSRDSSVIWVNFDGVGLSFDADSIHNFVLEKIKLVGGSTPDYEAILPSTKTSQVGLKISTTHNYVIRDCIFWNLYTAVEVGGASYYGTIESNKFLTNLIGFQASDIAGDGPSEASIVFNQFYGLAGAVGASKAINLDAGSGYLIGHNGIENFYIGVDSGSQEFVSFDRNRFEDNTQHIKQLGNVYSGSMLGAFGDWDSDDIVPFRGFEKFHGSYFGNFGVRAAWYAQDSTQVVWPLTGTNYANAAATGYGAGLKLKLSSEDLDAGDVETHKWAGVSAVAATNYADQVDLAFYVKQAGIDPPAEIARFTGESNSGTDKGLNFGVGTTTPSGFELALGGALPDSAAYGGYRTEARYVSATITASSSVVLSLNIPPGARLLMAQLKVAVHLAENWDASFSGGSTAVIDTNIAGAQETKVNYLFDDNAASPITTTSTTNITVTPNGGGSFSAQGNIRAVVYYNYFTPMS